MENDVESPLLQRHRKDVFTQLHIMQKEDFDFIGELPSMLKTEDDEEQ